MPNADLVFVETDPGMPEAVSLISALDCELRDRYPDLPIHGIEPVEFRYLESTSNSRSRCFEKGLILDGHNNR